MIDVYGSQSHYLDHLAPIWRALPDEIRGDVLFEGRGLEAHPLVVEAQGIRRRNETSRRKVPKAKRVVVAGVKDALSARRWGWGVALLEHGAGQTYVDDPTNPSYPGGARREGIGLFLCTNEAVAQRNEALYGSRSVVVGSPRLADLRVARGAHVESERPTLALCFHWDCTVAPESFWALPDFERSLVGLRNGFPGKVIGHGHPRVWKLLDPIYRSAGIEPVWSFEEVVRRADLVSFDNTSAGFEAAALGIPVVLLDGSKWRRDVEHGLRFWTFANLGPNVSGRGHPDEIAERWLGACELALWSERENEESLFRRRRMELRVEVYPYRGSEVERSVRALREWCGI